MQEKDKIRVVQRQVGIEVEDDEIDDVQAHTAAAAVGVGQ